MEDFKVGQLTKELVAIQLKKMEDPCAVAADLICKTLRVALKSNQEGGDKIIEDAVLGGMQGLLLAGGDVPRGAILVLEAVADLAAEQGLDPTLAFAGALAGLARLRRVLLPAQLDELKAAVGAHFMGAGEVFSCLLAQQPDPDRQTRSSL
jgi:hypothetical protein